MIFVSNIVSAALAGLTALPFPDTNFAFLDSRLVSYMRVLLKGRAHAVSAAGKHNTWTHAEVFTYWGILPTRAENQVRMVKWLQAIVFKHQAHKQVTAATWRDLRVDIEGAPILTILDHKGHVGPPSRANAMARSFEEAIWAIREISGSEDFFEEWALSDFSWIDLLACGQAAATSDRAQLAHLFEMLDPTLVRAAFKTNVITF